MLKNFKFLIFIIISLFLFSLHSCNENKNDTNLIKSNDKNIQIHFIDVGQGDSELILVNNKVLLIDSGSQTAEKKVLKYLKDLNINKIDYLIATHPHEDHIGNMDVIIKNFQVEKFYSPKVTTTTKAFKNMIKELKNKNLKINVIKEGTNSINLGKNTKVEIFSPPPNLNDKNLNNYSPVIKISYLNNSFLFTGDSEKENEEYILSKNYNLSADILKAPHHGSNTSLTKEFLKKVNPSLTIISCGKGNKYGHPKKDTLSKLKEINSKIYRTDKDGTIILISDGEKIWRKK